MNGAQMEILGTRKNKKAFCVQTCSWGNKWLFFGVTSVGGRPGCGAAVTAFLPLPLALFSRTDTLVCLAVPPEGAR